MVSQGTEQICPAKCGHSLKVFTGNSWSLWHHHRYFEQFFTAKLARNTRHFQTSTYHSIHSDIFVHEHFDNVFFRGFIIFALDILKMSWDDCCSMISASAWSDLQCPHWHARCCSFAQLPWAKVPTKSPVMYPILVSIGIKYARAGDFDSWKICKYPGKLKLFSFWSMQFSMNKLRLICAIHVCWKQA